MSHEKLETNIGLMGLMIVIVISFGGLAEIVPLFFLKDTTEPVTNLRPYSALEMEGRDVYIREGCNTCHSQMIRPFRAETERYGHYSVAGEHVWEHPFLWGSKRTGPDLARVGGRYSDEWHRVHLINPRDVVPESNMPAFPWLEEKYINSDLTAEKLKAFKEYFDVPYTDADIAGAKAAVDGKTELDAVVAYLQSLGHALSDKR
ncbi:cytochrome-c oxidase, cbb3-type subunit II [Aliikangiella marina]|uniref:Cytochrome-c oxidase, cbb3-type subunit II n=1 Tax=Aliikangiella marina TaxID=1712262 RepID=A0A545T353_9GAMM|nr:cytochrome-c oxidase, cbb3-type subunit II [Aliikangiella marina]TQV71647.1 cytochrome-c oxidase, cbb3-type subunit II [Aliikangiella marina]